MRNKIVFLILFCSVCASAHGADYRSNPYSDSESYVYFYRPCLAWGFANNIQVFDERGTIGQLNCRTYLIDQVDPGRHNYFAHASNGQADDSLGLYMDPGKKYFVKVDFGLLGNPLLELTKNLSEVKMARLSEVPSATYHKYYAILTKENLNRIFTYGDEIFDWMVKYDYLEKISRTKARVWNNMDLNELKNDLEVQFPDEGEHLINTIKMALYNVYVRKKFYDTLSAMGVLKNCKVKIEFEVDVNGTITYIKITSQTKGVPVDFLQLAMELVKQISPLAPLPEQLVQYHNGLLTKDQFEDTFTNGKAIFRWLVVYGYLQKVSDQQYHPIAMTDALKANLIKCYPVHSKKDP